MYTVTNKPQINRGPSTLKHPSLFPSKPHIRLLQFVQSVKHYDWFFQPHKHTSSSTITSIQSVLQVNNVNVFISMRATQRWLTWLLLILVNLLLVVLLLRWSVPVSFSVPYIFQMSNFVVSLLQNYTVMDARWFNFVRFLFYLWFNHETGFSIFCIFFQALQWLHVLHLKILDLISNCFPSQCHVKETVQCIWVYTLFLSASKSNNC